MIESCFARALNQPFNLQQETKASAQSGNANQFTQSMYVMVIAKLCCKPSPEISESLNVHRPLPESRARVRDNLAPLSQEDIAENPRHFIVLFIAAWVRYAFLCELWHIVGTF